MTDSRICPGRIGALGVSGLLALALGGCGSSQPTRPPSTASTDGHGHVYTSTTRKPESTSQSAPDTGTDAPGDPHEPAPERGGTIPRAARRAEDTVAAGAVSPTPQSALARFADLYMNWTANSVRRHQLELAEISIGSARLIAEQSAARVQGDIAIGRDSVSNSGEVVSISRGSASAGGYWVLVSREKTSGTGDYRHLPAQVHVTCARVRHLATGWVVSAWEPRD
jgi:hypothetical protein